MIAFVTVYLFVSSPPFFSIAPETDATQESDDTTDNLSFLPKQTGKHPLLSIPISPILFSLMLALELLLLLLYLF